MGKIVRLKGIKMDTRGRTVYDIVEMSDADTVLPGQDTEDILGDVFLELNELADDPAAPAANKARLYAKDNGSGKTVVYARFATGAIQAVATQP
jgi:hypothetical protein